MISLLRRQTLQLIFGSLGLLLLSGCNIFPESQPLSYYELPASPLSPLSQQPAPYTLQLLTPYANRTLNTQRILVNPEGYEMRAYQGAAWIDTPPALLRDRFAQALLEAQLVQALTFTGESGAADLALQLQLYRFQVHYEQNQPVVHVQLNAQLLSRQSGRILAVQPIYIKEPVAEGQTELTQVIPTFGTAVDKASKQLTQWLYQTLNDPKITQQLR